LPSNLSPSNGACVHYYARGHFRSRDEDGGHTIRSVITENPMLHANSMFYRSVVMADRSCTLREYAFSTLFAPVTLTLTFWPSSMNLPYFLEIHGMCKYELPTSRLSTVIVLHTYIHTDRQTDATEIIYHTSLHGWSIKVHIEIWSLPETENIAT